MVREGEPSARPAACSRRPPRDGKDRECRKLASLHIGRRKPALLNFGTIHNTSFLVVSSNSARLRRRFTSHDGAPDLRRNHALPVRPGRLPPWRTLRGFRPISDDFNRSHRNEVEHSSMRIRLALVSQRVQQPIPNERRRTRWVYSIGEATSTQSTRRSGTHPLAARTKPRAAGRRAAISSSRVRPDWSPELSPTRRLPATPARRSSARAPGAEPG
jgi:hypothetical protein